MSVALQFKLTQTGQAAVWNANNTGTSLNLTHIQFGSGNRAPSGTETALLTPQQAVAIAAGFSVSATQIRMSAIFGPRPPLPGDSTAGCTTMGGCGWFTPDGRMVDYIPSP